MCMPFFCNPRHNGSFYHCLLNSMARVWSVDDNAVFFFVGDANTHHSERLELVSPTDLHGSDALIIAICRVVRSWCAVPLTLLVKQTRFCYD